MKSDNKPTVWCYLRHSKTTEDQPNAMKAQFHILKNWTNERGYKKRKYRIEPNTSGSVPAHRRDRLSHILANIKKGDKLAVARWDRLTRDMDEFMRLYLRSKEEGWKLVSPELDLDIYGPTNRTNLLCILMKSYAANAEYTACSERQKQTVASRKERGLRYCKRRFGYDTVQRDPSDPVSEWLFKPNEYEQAVIEDMKNMRLAGHTWGKIAYSLNAGEVPAPAGRTWHDTTVRNIVERES